MFQKMTMAVTLTVVCLILISFPTNLDAEEQVKQNNKNPEKS